MLGSVCEHISIPRTLQLTHWQWLQTTTLSPPPLEEYWTTNIKSNTRLKWNETHSTAYYKYRDTLTAPIVSSIHTIPLSSSVHANADNRNLYQPDKQHSNSPPNRCLVACTPLAISMPTFILTPTTRFLPRVCKICINIFNPKSNYIANNFPKHNIIVKISAIPYQKVDSHY